MSTTTRSSNVSSPSRKGGGRQTKKRTTPQRQQQQQSQTPDSHRGGKGPPDSLDSVQDAAVSVIGTLNSRVETLHDKYKWEEPLTKQTQQLQQLTAFIAEKRIEGRFRTFKEFNALFDASSLPQDLRPLYDQLGALYDSFNSKVIRNAVFRLTESLVNGLVKYCLPLGELCATEIDIVRQYEKTHARLDSELNKDLHDLFTTTNKMEKLNFVKFLKSPEKSNDFLKKIRAAINKMYYIVNEWVDCDRTYIEDITDRLQEGRQRLEELDSEIEKARSNLQDERQMKKTQDEIDKLEEKAKQLKIKQNKYSASQQSNTTRLSSLEAELQEKTKRKSKLEEQRSKLEEQQRSGQGTSRSRTQQDLEWVTLQEREAGQDLERHKDTIASVQRYQKHLESSRAANDTDLRSTNEKLAKLRSNQDSMRRRHEKAQEQLAKLLAEQEALEPQVAELNLLRSKKLSSGSLKELHASGHINSPRKVQKPIAVACGDVAQQIGADWRNLYAHLPMEPDRTRSTRRRDVEKLDIIGNRRDLPEPELAAQSLERWRMMNPQSKPEGLLQALRKIERDELAQRVEHKFKYKKA
ncbi:hypothetical protein BOX15_Mlig016879g1 [Macrostomum lignano]|uniref:Death domain-containing protein n=1 Tax=Macrostomum lignano TaxID=282301 RepID=A0A267FF45_9PLAT|nr:hypothetical protein BOX15_Mlig016879g1 [Macrostomum lignano]